MQRPGASPARGFAKVRHAVPMLSLAKAYTDEQFARLMRTGEVLAGGTSASGLMTGVAKYRFNAMTDAEIQALKDYLDSR